MKRLIAFLLLLVMALALCGCGECKHEWTKASCTEPQYCTKCGLSNGAPLGHDFVGGVCTRCGVRDAAEPAPAEPEPAAPAPADPAPAEPAPAAPTPAPDPKAALAAEHAAKMQAQDPNLYVPDAMYFLDEPVVKTVVPYGGRYTYSLLRPEDSKEARIDNLYRGTVVNVIAAQNGFVLFHTDDGFYAWSDGQWIVNSDDAPYIMWGNSGSGKEMVVSYKHKIYVCYTPFKIWEHFALLSPGDKVTAYTTVNGFVFVECGATKGWVHASYLSEVG